MFSIGVDLGQRRDYSAVAIVEQPANQTAAAPTFDPRTLAYADELQPPVSIVRHLERLPLGTPYTHVTARLVEIARTPEMAGQCQLVVDATGVGMPVLDMLRAARPGCPITAVWITAGHAAHFDGALWHVPKLELMANLQAMLELKSLLISRRTRESATLVRELLDIRTTRGRSGSIQASAQGAGQHDDLAMAVALAAWLKQRPAAGPQPRRLSGI
jgi:hypothetical protein